MPWKRHPFRGGSLSRALNIADLRELARRRVPHFVFEYVEGGAEDEATLRGNRAAFERLRLVPQDPDRHLGARTAYQPSRAAGECTAGHRAHRPQQHAQPGRRHRAGARRGQARHPLHPEHVVDDPPRGCGAARRRPAVDAAVRDAASAPSRATSCARAARPATRRWCSPPMPTYAAAANGISATTAHREDRRCAPCSTSCATRAGWSGAGRKRHAAFPQPRGLPAARRDVRRRRQHHHAADVRRQHQLGRHRLDPRGYWQGKLLIKGVLNVADAERALRWAATASWSATTAGGSSITACHDGGAAGDRRRSRRRLPILIDSGFRRGTDMVKALALGAQAVQLGRATGLRSGGRRLGGRRPRAADPQLGDDPGARAARLQLGRRARPAARAAGVKPQRALRHPDTSQRAGDQRSGDLSSSSRYCFHSAATVCEPWPRVRSL